MKIFP